MPAVVESGWDERLRQLPAEEAVPRLLDAYGGRIYRLASRICESPEEAQDLVQEVFLAAFRKWSQFQGRSSPSTWLYTIATRVCRRLHRRRAGQPARLEPISGLLAEGRSAVLEIPSGDADPHEAAVRSQIREGVEEALSALPFRFRMPLILKDILELSVKDTATALGIKEATVKTRLHRARLSLRKAMAARLPKRKPSTPSHSQRVCLDLLALKQSALDRGETFPLDDRELCEQCRSLIASLDLGVDICRAIGRGELPLPLREAILRRMGSARA